MTVMNAAALADLIEAGLAAETLVEKQQLLPPGGKKDRRILFEAIAEAVLTYLKARQDAFTLVLTGTVTGHVELASPGATATQTSPGTVQVKGEGFSGGASVKIRWTEDQGSPASATADSTGKFTASVSVPAALRDGHTHFLDVRDTQGEAALAAVTTT